jgi:hypothetical protein
MKVLWIPYSFKRGIWPLNVGIVLFFSLEWWFALVINIIWIFIIALGPLNVGIAFGEQDPFKYT